MTQHHELPSAGGASAERKRAVLGRFVRWALIGGLAGIVATLVALRVIHRDPTPPLSPEIFEQARSRWKASGPEDYDIAVRVSGSQPALYRVEVRGGQPKAAWRNGRPLANIRTFGTWSVPGMFSTMSRDVEAIERHAAGKALPTTPRLSLRASFDPRYSYPARYRRIEWGSPVDVAWDVVEFTPSPHSAKRRGEDDG